MRMFISATFPAAQFRQILSLHQLFLKSSVNKEKQVKPEVNTSEFQFISAGLNFV